MRRLISPLAYLAVAVVMTLAAYWLMFAQFQQYDDEGYVELTLRHFLRGDNLYSEINTQYGPAYYLGFGAIFKLTGAAVSTNSGRLIQVAVWITTSLLCGVAAQRVTRSLLLGLLTTAVTFSVLTTVLAEPMHPSAVLALLTGAAAFSLAVVVPWKARVGLATLGAIGATTALVKINVGGFLLIASAFAVATCLPGWPNRTRPRLLLSALVIAVGPLLVLPDIDSSRIQNLAIVVAAGAGAIVLTAAGPSARDEPGAGGWWLWFTGGAIAATLILAIAAVAVGTGLSDIVDGVLIRPMGQRNVFRIEPPIVDAALLWALASVGVAWCVRRGTLSLDGTTGGVVRVATGLAIWFTITKSGPLAIGPSSPLGLAPLLAWMAAVPPAGALTGARERLVRVGLPMIAVLQILHTYPVAGAQTGTALALFALIGAICFSDGILVLSAQPRFAGLPNLRLAASGAIAGWAILVFVIRAATTAHGPYEANVQLPFQGADRMRLPATQAEQFRQVVGTLEAAGCRLVVAQPTLGSITMWANADVPLGLEPDGWTIQLDSGQQQKVLDRVRRGPPPCGLRNDVQAAGWQQGRPVADRPMVRYIESLRPAQRFGDYQLLSPRPAP